MEFLSKYQPVILLVFGILVLVLLGVALFWLYRLNRNLERNKFSLTGLLERDPDTGTRSLSLLIGNRSLGDVTVTALGVTVGSECYNLIRFAREERLTIAQRSAQTMSVPYAELEEMLFRDCKAHRFARVKIYTVDSSGGIYHTGCVTLRRALNEGWREVLRRRAEAEASERAEKAFREKAEFVARCAARKAQGQKLGFSDGVKYMLWKKKFSSCDSSGQAYDSVQDEEKENRDE